MVLTATEAAEHLHISINTLYAYANAGIIPGRKIGKTWRFSEAGLDNWLQHKEEKEETTRKERIYQWN